MSFLGKLIGAVAAPFTGGASLIGTLASGASTVAGMLGGGSKGGGLSQIGSLAGSLIDRNAARNDRDFQNWYNDPLQQRVRAERAGINPLAYISNVPSAAMGAGGMAVGQALADASLVLGDTLEKRDLARAKTTQLEQQNEELRKRDVQRVLRPDVGGIFGGGDVPHRSSLPPIGAQSSQESKGSEFDPLAKYQQPIPFDPDRPVEAEPSKNFSGFFGVQNKLTADRPIYMVGEEPEDMMDYMFQGWHTIPQLAFRWGQKIGTDVDRDAQSRKWKRSLISSYDATGGQWVDGTLIGKRPKPRPQAYTPKRSPHALKSLGF